MKTIHADINLLQYTAERRSAPRSANCPGLGQSAFIRHWPFFSILLPIPGVLHNSCIYTSHTLTIFQMSIQSIVTFCL